MGGSGWTWRYDHAEIKEELTSYGVLYSTVALYLAPVPFGFISLDVKEACTPLVCGFIRRHTLQSCLTGVKDGTFLILPF